MFLLPTAKPKPEKSPGFTKCFVLEFDLIHFNVVESQKLVVDDNVCQKQAEDFSDFCLALTNSC